MENQEFMFDAWQIYKSGADIYENPQGLLKATKKVKRIRNRKDVFHFEVIKVDNDVLVVSENTHSLNFAFIGSDDLRDWINNLKYKSDSVEDELKVHPGFEASVKKFKKIIRDKIEEYITKYDYGNVKGAKVNINFIGHSRGGALALLAAKDLAEKDSNFQNISCVTFGQPRVGNNIFDIELEKTKVRYLRIVFSNDPVCEIPLTEMGYEHPWFGDVEILPESWWHRFHFKAIRVHLDYNRTINKLEKKIKKNLDAKWDRG